MTENEVRNRVVALSAKIGIYLWRNNSGVAINPNGQPVRFGLGNTSSKINKVFKTPDLVGISPDGFFIGVECKRSGWKFRGTDHEIAQLNALNIINENRGLGVFINNPDMFIYIYQLYKIKNPCVNNLHTG